jgi:hypothetical protein
LRRAGEFEGLVVNLQVQWWIEQSGGTIICTLDELGRALQQLGPLRGAD